MSQTPANPAQQQQLPPEEEPVKAHELKTSSMTLNLTSMIDVVFQLLIYFVLTMNFTVGEGVLTSKVPAGAGSGPATEPKPPERPLNIVLSASGAASCRITVEGAPTAPMNFTELAQVLEQMQRDPARGRSGMYEPDNPIVIKPDGQVRWQHVVNAFNATIKARYSNVSFAATSGG